MAHPDQRESPLALLRNLVNEFTYYGDVFDQTLQEHINEGNDIRQFIEDMSEDVAAVLRTDGYHDPVDPTAMTWWLRGRQSLEQIHQGFEHRRQRVERSRRQRVQMDLLRQIPQRANEFQERIVRRTEERDRVEEAPQVEAPRMEDHVEAPRDLQSWKEQQAEPQDALVAEMMERLRESPTNWKINLNDFNIRAKEQLFVQLEEFSEQ